MTPSFTFCLLYLWICQTPDTQNHEWNMSYVSATWAISRHLVTLTVYFLKRNPWKVPIHRSWKWMSSRSIPQELLPTMAGKVAQPPTTPQGHHLQQSQQQEGKLRVHCRVRVCEPGSQRLQGLPLEVLWQNAGNSLHTDWAVSAPGSKGKGPTTSITPTSPEATEGLPKWQVSLVKTAGGSSTERKKQKLKRLAFQTTLYPFQQTRKENKSCCRRCSDAHWGLVHDLPAQPLQPQNPGQSPNLPISMLGSSEKWMSLLSPPRTESRPVITGAIRSWMPLLCGMNSPRCNSPMLVSRVMQICSRKYISNEKKLSFLKIYPHT